MTLIEQTVILILIVFYGFFIGIIFDGYRVIVGKNKVPVVVLYSLDILFGIITALCLFQLLLWINHGQIRIIMILIFIVSLLSYYLLISKPIIRKWLKIYNLFLGLLRYVAKISNMLLIKPISVILKIFVKSLKFVFVFIHQIFYNIVQVIFNIAKKLKKSR